MQRGVEYFAAPSGWTPEDKNPFTGDGVYGAGWSCFCLGGDRVRLDFYGSGGNGLFIFRLGRQSPELISRLADFLRYEVRQGRRVIFSFPEGADIDSIVETALDETPEENVVRPEDPRWTVHSTNLSAWASIRREGKLKSLSRLIEEGRPVISVGFRQLGEPGEYADYIILGRIDNVNSEHVVASQQKGFIFTEEHTPYEPGVRLYFDNHALIRAGLGTRDGLHTIKVRHYLPLDPFLVGAVGRAEVDPSGTVSEWTPRSFWLAANGYFYQRVGRE